MNEKDTLIKEWEERVKTIPVTTIKNEDKLAKYVKGNGMTKEDLTILLTIVITTLPDFRRIKVKPDATITFGELLEWYEKAQVQFIIIHRVNYMIHEAMITVYDLLERYKLLKFMAKKESKLAEEEWENYEGPRRKTTQREAWSTLQDHLRIASDLLRPRLEKVYESIRDYMIRLSWRNVELKARIEVALMLAKVGKHSFRAFFKEFEDACGADFSRCFDYADMSAMEKHFSKMSDSIGFKTEKDRHGSFDIIGFDCDANQRVKWAWGDFIKDLRDNDLMDESAVRAIELNPTIAEDYHRELEAEERAKMDAKTEALSEKFKVTKRLVKAKAHTKQ